MIGQRVETAYLLLWAAILSVKSILKFDEVVGQKTQPRCLVTSQYLRIDNLGQDCRVGDCAEGEAAVRQRVGEVGCPASACSLSGILQQRMTKPTPGVW